jgi:hypothetical protein
MPTGASIFYINLFWGLVLWVFELVPQFISASIAGRDSGLTGGIHYLNCIFFEYHNSLINSSCYLTKVATFGGIRDELRQ